MAVKTVMWSLGNEESATCATNACPRPIANGRGCGHSAPMIWLKPSAVIAVKNARTATLPTS